MKKYIFPVLVLALMTGCGKISEASEDKPIQVVSGTIEGTTTDNSTTYSDIDKSSTALVTTSTNTAGSKISGTTAVSSKGGSVQTATRASGGSGGVYGTTRSVPVAPKTSTNAGSKPITTTTTAQSPSFDPKDFSSIAFELSEASPNKIEVSREFSDGRSRSYQVLSVDTAEIQRILEEDPTKSINDLIVRVDYDFDHYPDIFILEKQDELNKAGKYYRYDPVTGTYQSWSELNSLHFEIKCDETAGTLAICENKDNEEYEEKIYMWNEHKQLVLRYYTHKYSDTEADDILMEYIAYDENGGVISRELFDRNGNLIEDHNDEGTENE